MKNHTYYSLFLTIEVLISHFTYIAQRTESIHWNFGTSWKRKKKNSLVDTCGASFVHTRMYINQNKTGRREEKNKRNITNININMEYAKLNNQ
jgi:hypothetical protein